MRCIQKGCLILNAEINVCKCVVQYTSAFSVLTSKDRIYFIEITIVLTTIDIIYLHVS